MVRRKITYYKMLTPERRAEIAAAVGATDLATREHCVGFPLKRKG